MKVHCVTLICAKWTRACIYWMEILPLSSCAAVDAVGKTFSLADRETKNANGRIHRQMVK